MRNKRAANATAYFEIDLGREELTEVEFTGEVIMVDNGIGKYEYWGQNCTDTQWEPECETFLWDEKLYSKEENETILKWVDGKEEKITDELIESASFDND